MAFRHVILWLHILAVVVWMGGLVFQWLVVWPILSRATTGPERLRLGLVLEARFRAVMWPVVGLVLFTGLYNVMRVLYATSLAGGRLPLTFARLLGVKLLLVALMIAIQAMLQWVIHPRRVAQFRAVLADPDVMSTAPLTLECWSRRLHLLTVALAAGAVFLGVLLRG
jgi:uncharacterized membrane protein